MIGLVALASIVATQYKSRGARTNEDEAAHDIR